MNRPRRLLIANSFVSPKNPRGFKQNSRRQRRGLFLALILSSLSLGDARAQLPEGGNIVSGAGVISTSGLTTDVTTSTGRAVIDWNNFSIAQGATVNFHQPSADSAVLNRVITSGTPTLIHGALSSNGNVFLVNPSGVLVGSNGAINTNGFVASTLDISNSDFMEGKNLELKGNSNASIINQGTITTGTGGAHLIAKDIHNSGVISSHGGSINLASGGVIQLPNGNQYIQADIQTLANGISPTASMIQNTGTIRVTGALKVGHDVYLVNPGGNIVNTGSIAAQLKQPNSSKSIGGNVKIDAADGVAKISGSVDVSGDLGGTVVVTGKSVQLNNSSINASGTTSGGEVLIGGGLHGQDTRVANAANVDISADTVINVSTSESGNAGTTIVWSDVATNFFGTIYANANGLSGNGGFVEVSGKTLNYLGFTSLKSVVGEFGTLLLDPTTFTINDSNIDTIRQQWGAGNLSITATEAINILAELFPANSAGEELTDASPTRLTLKGVNSADNPNITIAAAVRDSRYYSSSGTNEFNANGGSFVITNTGSVSLQDQLLITAGSIDLQGALKASEGITINARDNVANTNTLSVGLGSNSTGQLLISDTSLGNLKSTTTLNGSDFDIDFGTTTGFEEILYINGSNINIDGYSGSGLLINGDHLSITGPVTNTVNTDLTSTSDAATFRYRGPLNQSIGLGNVIGSDITISDAILAGITGFGHLEIGNKSSTSSPLTVTNANLGHFSNLTLFGSTIAFDSVTVGKNLNLTTQDLIIQNMTSKTEAGGMLVISTLDDASNVGVGEDAIGDLVVTRQELTDLGIYDSLLVQTGSGEFDIDIDLGLTTDFNTSIAFKTTGAMTIGALNTNTQSLTLSSSDIDFSTDSDPLSKTITGNAQGSLNLVSIGNNAHVMAIGESTGTWVLDNEEIGEITGFQSLQFTTNSGSSGAIDIINADLTGITKANGATSFSTNAFKVSGDQGLTIDGALSINTKTLELTGPINTLASEPVKAMINLGTSSLGVGDGTSGNEVLDQASLELLSGFDGIDFRAAGFHIDAIFDENVSFTTLNNATAKIDNITHIVSGKSTSIVANRIDYDPGATITSDGDVSIQAQYSSAGSDRLILDRGDIGDTNANGNVSVSNSNDDIWLSILNPNGGMISATASKGSIDILSNGTTNFGTLRVSDSDDTFNSASPETLKIRSSAGDLVFKMAVDVNGFADIVSPDRIITTDSGVLSTTYSNHNTNNDIRLYLESVNGIYHIDSTDPSLKSGARLGSSQMVTASTTGGNADIWLDASNGTGTLHLDAINSTGNISVDGSSIQTHDAITVAGDNAISLRATKDILINNDVYTNGSGSLNLVAGWDRTSAFYTPFDVTAFRPTPSSNPNLSSSLATTYGVSTGTVSIGNGSQTHAVSVGSLGGETNVFAKSLNVTANTGGQSAQLGHRFGLSSDSPSGAINVFATDAVNVTGGLTENSYAQIGHGDRLGNSDTGRTVAGDIIVQAKTSIALNNGSVGHSIDSDGTYSSGKTYLGTSSGEVSTGNETIAVNGTSQLRSAGVDQGGELRVYGSGRDNITIGNNSLWNGVLGSTFNTSSPLPNQDYELPFLGTYLGNSAQNWSIYYNIVKLSVQALDGSSVYGDTPINPGLTLLDGVLIGGDTLESIGLTTNFNVTPTTNAGTYQISINASSLNSRYRLVDSVVGTFTVTPAPLTVLANDALKFFRDSIIFSNADWSVTGLKNGETIGSIDLTSAGSHPNALPGYFSIVASNAQPGTLNLGNYTIDYIVGNLIVTPNSGHYNYDTWQRHIDMARSIWSLFDPMPATVTVDAGGETFVTSNFE